MPAAAVRIFLSGSLLSKIVYVFVPVEPIYFVMELTPLIAQSKAYAPFVN
jgi:hypothetical protein